MMKLKKLIEKIQGQLKSIEKQLNDIQAPSPDTAKNLENYTNTVNEFLNRTNKITLCLADLRRRMWHTNVWFHLVRNNPRHREQYYFALIAMVGYENWKNVDPTLRMNWESARLSFDRMYGMVKDFAENAEKYAGLFDAASEKQEPATPELPADHSKQLNEIHKDLTKKIEGISSDLDKKLENLTRLLPPQEKIKELRDALNAWIPPDDKADKE